MTKVRRFPDRRGGICRGEAGELPPSLDLTFTPTGLSEI